MKILDLITICLLLIPGFSMGQSDFEKKAPGLTCDCINKAPDKRPVTEKIFLDCLQKVFASDSAEISAELLKTYGDMSDEHAHEFGERLSYDIMVDMVKTCDIFFLYMDSFRRSQFEITNRDSLNNVVTELEKTPETMRNIRFHKTLITDYLFLKQYDKALLEIDKVKSLTPDDPALIIYKAHIKYFQGKYDEAISLYQQAVDISGSGPIRVLIEVVRREQAMH